MAPDNLELRVSRLEQALASLAAPTLMQGGHDSQAMLMRWFADFEHLFKAPEAKPAAAPTASRPSAPPPLKPAA